MLITNFFPVLRNFDIIITTFFFFFCFFLLTIADTAFSVDSHFEACKNHVNCGSGPDISYPFWIQGLQKPYCGYPGFNITCKNNHPILTISSNEYVILEISNDVQTLRVSTFQVQSLSGNSSCVVPFVTHNLTFNQTPFKLGPNQIDLFLFFNCSASLPDQYLPYSIDCPAGNSSNWRRSLALFEHDQDLSNVNNSGICETLVIAPVDRSGNESIMSDPVSRGYNFIIKLMNKGFILTWNASRCEVCEESGGHCGFDYTMYSFVCFCPDRPHSKRCHGDEISLRNKLAIGLGAGSAGVFLTCLAFFIYLIRNKRIQSFSMCFSKNSNQSEMDMEDFSTTYYGVHVFSYAELKEATNNFDDSRELGDGGFGTVYHGKLRDGRSVAVKRMYESNYKRFEQFRNEVEILAQLRHQNLVSLYGCTSRESRELLLVYEFIPNGTVADHLHGEHNKAGLLTWPIRMRIAIETATALAYLHASNIVHRDIKTNNILLDKNFSVKVADFGLSRPFPTDVTHISTAPQGTPGYVDPKYYQCYQLTSKSDVYSFGVVLFELISSKPAVDISRHQHEINLSDMAINKIQNGALHELVDPSLGFESDRNTRRMITLVAELGFQCLQQEKEMRPPMEEVLEILKEIESDEYKAEKAVEMDVPADDIGSLDNTQLLSPDLIADKCTKDPATPDANV